MSKAADQPTLRRSTSASERHAAEKNLDIGTLRQWQSELNEFVSHTRSRLQSLSAAVTQHDEIVQTTVLQPNAIGGLSDRSDETAEADGLPPHPQAKLPTPPPASADQTDPMTRLNAVKLRLAKQINHA